MTEEAVAMAMEQVAGNQEGTIDRNLVRFIHVLRQLGIRVSLAETLDAVNALIAVDIIDRSQVREALGSTLVKGVRERRLFELAFDRFFAPGEQKEQWRLLEERAREDRARLLERAGEEIVSGVIDSGGVNWAGGTLDHLRLSDKQKDTFARMPEGERRKMLQMMSNFQGNPVNDPSGLIAQVVEASLNYWRYHLARQEVEEGSEVCALPEVQYSGDVEINEIVRSVAETYSNQHEESLLHRDLQSISGRDLAMASVLVERLARRLATRMSRRYRSSRKRQAIDLRKTIRGSIGFGGIPVKLSYRSKRVQKPRLVLICDVSASMANYARFVIQFVYSLSSVVKDAETFIFAEDLERITPELKAGGEFAGIMARVISGSSQWGKTTNLPEALNTFNKHYSQLLNGETFVLIVSDTKTQGAATATALMAKIRGRIKELIWLNTLPRRQWSEVATVVKFQEVSKMFECSTLAQLEEVLRQEIA